MHKPTFAVAVAALGVSVFTMANTPSQRADAGPPADQWKSERQYPPLVFSSKAWLDCSISSTQNGRQAMTTMSGQGFDFAAPMQPIKGGKVKVQGNGMLYKFNSFPTAKIPAKFKGLGAGTIMAMKAEVEVDVKRFQQPGGPGTEIHFNAGDINADAAYVEFTGVFVRQSDARRFPFRVLFGSVSDGSGRVTPGNARPEAPLMSKAVVLGTPQKPATVTTALYEAEDDVPALP
jgi:hypothetical protein